MKTILKKILPRRLASALRKLCWDVLGLSLTTRSGLHLDIKSPGDWYILKEIFINCEYDQAIQHAIKLCSEDKKFRVLDLGANVGYFSFRVVDLSLMNSMEPSQIEIVAVEGDPKTYKDLVQRIDLNSANRLSIRPVLGLVGSRGGSGSIRHSEFGPKSSILESHGNDVYSVPFIDLEKQTETYSEIDLLKCDIEGAEELFIENYPQLLSRTRVAVFEIHRLLCDADRCIKMLEDAGLRLIKKIKNSKGTDLVLFVRRSEV
ncbi:MAG: FkbM family methyltransferase [Acidobacteria bacterium]|nr:MAG: FkbM family methyltransferase [Acidobacteriota bacterium]REK01471.1 MAG: FkbM family methyltransferase [Acidobacteriota bacterium]REK14427.1 MAG: FkbM family methyltransferase [Acidobacteriota bacterium]REK45142.1 MAG: FkbM family methyltransferase [Acidobacteriota bacterium]